MFNDLMNSTVIEHLRFYDGREKPIEKDQLIKFEIKSVIDRFYSTRNIDATTVVEDIGPTHIDYTNIQHWSTDIPDIDNRSVRLFTLWAEDEENKEVVLILRGFYVLVPFKFAKEALEEYYYYDKDTPCYPLVVVSAFRTIYTDIAILSDLIERVKLEIEFNWQKVRQKAIDTINKESDLWERYVISLNKIIHVSFLIPSIDRELITAFKQKNFQTTGVMQILTSPTPSYTEIMAKSHLTEAKKLIKKYKPPSDP